MSPPHECTACSGTRYDGANLTCQICLKPFFFECLINNKRNEVLELVNCMKTQAGCTPGTRMQTKIQKIFNDTSVFSFVCTNCKPKKALRTVVDEYKSQIDENIKNVECLMQ